MASSAAKDNRHNLLKLYYNESKVFIIGNGGDMRYVNGS